MALSMKNWWPLSGANVDRIDGATELWRKPVHLPFSSMPTSSSSTEVVW